MNRLWRRMIAPALASAIAILAGPAICEVVDAETGGSPCVRATIAASPAKVWQAMSHPGAWWDPAHTYSGASANLSLDLRPGGYWQETLPDGGVIHMVVVNVEPGRLLRLAGASVPSNHWESRAVPACP
jgi:hypothetical protein